MTVRRIDLPGCRRAVHRFGLGKDCSAHTADCRHIATAGCMGRKPVAVAVAGRTVKSHLHTDFAGYRDRRTITGCIGRKKTAAAASMDRSRSLDSDQMDDDGESQSL